MRKFQLIIFFVFFTTLGFSQSINNNDIDIFFEILEEYNYEGYNDYDEEIRKYIATQIDAIAFTLIYIHKIEDGFSISIDELGELYRHYLSTDAPENIEEIFRKYGWEHNGHKTFWKIFYIGFCSVWCELYFMESEGENHKELLEKLSNVKDLFEKSDFELINMRREEFCKVEYRE